MREITLWIGFRMATVFREYLEYTVGSIYAGKLPIGYRYRAVLGSRSEQLVSLMTAEIAWKIK